MALKLMVPSANVPKNTRYHDKTVYMIFIPSHNIRVVIETVHVVILPKRNVLVKESK